MVVFFPFGGLLWWRNFVGCCFKVENHIVWWGRWSWRTLVQVSWFLCFWKIIVFERVLSIFGCLWKNFILCKSVSDMSLQNKRSFKSEWANSSAFKINHKFEKQVLPFHWSFFVSKNSPGLKISIFLKKMQNEKIFNDVFWSCRVFSFTQNWVWHFKNNCCGSEQMNFVHCRRFLSNRVLLQGSFCQRHWCVFF